MLPCSLSSSGCWKSIVKLGERKLSNGRHLNSYFVGIVGEGSSINFWGDTWLANEPLRIKYPNLFALEKNKWVAVSNRVMVSNGERNLAWEWRRSPSTNDEVMELFDLLAAIYNYQWKEGGDRWEWRGDKEGVYTVSKAKRLIANRLLTVSDAKIKWKGWPPLKCKIMVWRAVLNRLPTRSELQKRGIHLDDLLCPLCNTVAETATHLFTGCFFTSEIWARVGSWCRLNPIFAFEVSDLAMMADTYSKTKEEKQIIRGIIYTSMWCIWNERNARIFTGKSRKAIEVVETIKSSSFFWVRHRSRLKVCHWNVWCKYPMNLM
ncbi:reverse transcriptase domain, Reverse transcriptase zinc-binding domain protein [Artemisia annua]|uniref:Reverse transcriptase domain, Reverse transcriptase zinc-binding domain protein n=1 Tax=Artemisia annua TaxID=35608 RepID=A0A2U1KNU9_ARTAN|nr:reverse transcriptase domain, Reverse transcriptase zinc-binding domain protein [Artemisia annua]